MNVGKQSIIRFGSGMAPPSLGGGGGSNGLIPSEALIARRTEISATHTVDSQPDPDVIIGVDTSLAAVVVNLPPAALQTSGRLLVIHDIGNAGTNKIGLSPDGTDTINGAVNGTDGSGSVVYALEITIDYGSATLVCDGVSGWFVIAAI